MSGTMFVADAASEPDGNVSGSDKPTFTVACAERAHTGNARVAAPPSPSVLCAVGGPAASQARGGRQAEPMGGASQVKRSQLSTTHCIQRAAHTERSSMEIFDYDNVLLLPRQCRVQSRSECDTSVEFGG